VFRRVERIARPAATARLLLILTLVSAAAAVRPAFAQAPAAPAAAALMRLAEDAAARGLPFAPLANKVREGLAKGHSPRLIEQVVRDMTNHLAAADRLIREFEPTAAAGPTRDGSVVLMAEAFGAGITPDEVRELRRQGQAGGRGPATVDALAGASRGLATIKLAKLPAAEGSAVMAEALRRGYRSHEVVDIAREIRRREADFRAGRVTLAALREAIARGDRPEQLFPERPAAAERPTRPEAVERPARPERPERPQPVERPGR
jgi:hypothetical protein